MTSTKTTCSQNPTTEKCYFCERNSAVLVAAGCETEFYECINCGEQFCADCMEEELQQCLVCNLDSLDEKRKEVRHQIKLMTKVKGGQ
jgi:hypothetical protein